MTTPAPRRWRWLRALARRLLGPRERAAPSGERYPHTWPSDAPRHEDFAAALSDAPARPSQVAASAMHLVRYGRAASAVAEARQHLELGYRARHDVARFSLQLPIEWAADPHRDDNWRVQLNMLRLLDPFIRAYEESRDSAHLRTALGFCLDWHEYHHVKGRQHPYAWRDMMTGVRSLRLAYLAEAIRNGALDASAAQRAAFADMLYAHWRRLSEPGFFRYTNHTIWDLHGLMSLLRLALDDGDPRLDTWRNALGERLDHLVALQFDEHGVHRENSPHYHFVASTMFRTLLESGWYHGASQRLGPVMDRARAIDAWMRFPDGRVLPIGDSDGKAPSGQQLPTPADTLPGDGLTTLNHSGYCMVRRLGVEPARRWSVLAIKAGFDLPGHMHHDVLSYLWSESGCDIVIDPGKFSYDQSPMRDHIRSNSGHNLIEFDGRNCDASRDQSTGHTVHSVREQSWGVRIVARMTHRPVKVVHERIYCYAPGRWLLTIDRFKAPRALAFAHFTHLAPEFSATAVEPGGFEVRHRDGQPLGVTHWSSMPLQAAVHTGVSGDRPQGWISRGYRQIEPCPALSLSGRAAAGCVVMALSLDPIGALVQSDDGQLVWSCAGTTLPLDTGPLGRDTATY